MPLFTSKFLSSLFQLRLADDNFPLLCKVFAFFEQWSSMKMFSPTSLDGSIWGRSYRFLIHLKIWHGITMNHKPDHCVLCIHKGRRELTRLNYTFPRSQSRWIVVPTFDGILIFSWRQPVNGWVCRIQREELWSVLVAIFGIQFKDIRW